MLVLKRLNYNQCWKLYNYWRELFWYWIRHKCQEGPTEMLSIKSKGGSSQQVQILSADCLTLLSVITSTFPIWGLQIIPVSCDTIKLQNRSFMRRSKFAIFWISAPRQNSKTQGNPWPFLVYSGISQDVHFNIHSLSGLCKKTRKTGNPNIV